MGNLTPNIMMAGQGLLEDDALDANADLSAAISVYAGYELLTQYSATVLDMQSDLYDMTTNPDGIQQSTINLFISTMAALPDFVFARIPAAYTQIDGTPSYITLLSNHISNTMPASNGKFALYLQIAMGYKEQANAFINSATNGADLGSQTFTSMDALMSGNISAVNRYTSTWGQDLLNSGNLYDFSRLDIFGTPQALVESLIRQNLLSNVAEALQAQGVNAFDLQTAISDNPGMVMSSVAQRRCYNALTTIQGDELEEILYVMGVVTTGLTTLTDLLDPVKMFPNSFQTITSLNNGTLENIYADANGTIAPYVQALETPFSVVMPEDIAKANYAYAISLEQIKKIYDSTPAIIGEQATTLETNQGLTDIDSLTQAVPADVTTYYQTQVGGGSGPDGTFYLSDFFGSVAGIAHNEALGLINPIVSTALSGIAARMTQIQNYAGNLSFTNRDDLVLGVINVLLDSDPGNDSLPLTPPRDLVGEVDYFLTTYATDIPVLTAAFEASIDQVLVELTALSAAGIEFVETYVSTISNPSAITINASRQSTLGFAQNLHSYSSKTDKGNIVEILEKTATTTRGGQAIIASMREGRNFQNLTNAGITLDNKIDDQPSIVEPGDIQDSTY